jgi:myo-inositol-1(or 4)-monophosphatase
MLDILQKSALIAGQKVLSYFNSSLDIHQKTSHQNIVTQADYQSQSIVVQEITNALKSKGIKEEEIGFIGEENLTKSGKYLCIIDPLDGTTNYASGFPYFCVSIALAVNEIINTAVVYNPYSDEMFYSQLGKGAYKKFKDQVTKLQIQPTELSQTLVSAHFNSPSDIRQKQFKIYEQIFPLVRNLRMVGSIALELCHFSENIFNIVINGHAKLWDFAASRLIINESGGELYNWEGLPVVSDFQNPTKSYQILASSSENMQKLQNILSSK